MGIDYGEKRIGVAVSDPLGIVAQGIDVVESRGLSNDVDNIRKLVDRYGNVEEIVVGLPKTLKGELGPQAQKVTKFIEALKKCVDVTVVTWDERLTTSAVERVLIDADMSRKKRKKVVDKTAAAYMLQGYLDARRSKANNEKNN